MEFKMRGFIGGLILGLVIGVMLAVASPQTNTLVNGKKEAKGLKLKKTWERQAHRSTGSFPAWHQITRHFQRCSPRRCSDYWFNRGGVKMSYHAAGSQENSLELFNAVSFGTIEAVFSRTGNWGNKSRGFDF